MSDKHEKFNAADIIAALKEKNITAESLAADIKFFLDEYLVGSAKLDGKAVEVKFLNTQSFKITVEEKR